MNHHLKQSSPPDVHIVFPAEEHAVRRALHSVSETLRTLSFDQDALATAEIVLAEVMNNIVEHAYEHVETGTIRLCCRKSRYYFKFEVMDQGKMLPGGELPPKRNHDLSTNLQNLPEGGFGWGLIRDLSSTLRYRRDDGQNTLRFTIACN